MVRWPTADKMSETLWCMPQPFLQIVVRWTVTKVAIRIVIVYFLKDDFTKQVVTGSAFLSFFLFLVYLFLFFSTCHTCAFVINGKVNNKWYLITKVPWKEKISAREKISAQGQQLFSKTFYLKSWDYFARFGKEGMWGCCCPQYNSQFYRKWLL